MCYGVFVGHVYELVLVLDAYASYIHFELKCMLCHVAAKIKKFIKFQSCLKFIKIWFEFA